MYYQIGRRFGKVLNVGLEPDSPELRKILLIDGMATRYHLLPSQIIQQADIFDLYVMDTAQAWQAYCYEQENAKTNGKAPVAPKLSQAEMLKMMERVKK